MFAALKAWRRKRVLRNFSVRDEAWVSVVSALPILRGLSDAELAQLRELATLFLHEKACSAAGGGILSETLRLKIAAQACLPILNLGLDWYGGWVEVVVYPDEFVPEHEYMDEAGVVHRTRMPMIGESWQQGPVILSAADVEMSGEHDGVNVVIHEFAHKLDMRNGGPDGFPPLHRDMERAAWSRDFTAAYEDFCHRVDCGLETAIDPYGSESPAEFFAVASEAFFEIPHVLQDCYPQVYRQLSAFYRQNPAARMETAG